MYADPSGHDFTLVESLVVGAIIGGSVGGIGGFTYAVAYKHAKIFSVETLEDTLVGGVTGAAVGALAGAATFTLATVGWEGTLEVIKSGLRQYARKIAGTHSTTAAYATNGFALGFLVGFVHPDIQISAGSAVTTASLYLQQGILEGIRKNASRIGAGTFVEDLGAIAGFAAKYGVGVKAIQNLAGGSFLALAFAQGFTTGYYIGAATRTLGDEVGDAISSWLVD
jgi:hypothetical protein